MDEIGSNDKEKGWADEETVQPPMMTDTDDGVLESSNEEHQEKDSDAEQGAKSKCLKTQRNQEAELHQAEKLNI